MEKNDLQIGMGTADNTGSKVEFSSMKHSMGLVHLMFSPSNVVMARLLKSDGTTLRDVGKTNIYACETFNPTSYKIANSSNSKNEECHNYLYIGNPYVGLTFSPDASSTFTWNINSVSLVSNVVKDVEITCTKQYKYRSNFMNAYSYTGNIQTFSATANKVYLFEVWGAQGGGSTYGGKGGYSVGSHIFSGNNILYICVGSRPDNGNGGYNGGGSNYKNNVSGGGGATHIAQRTGLLKDLVDYKTDILLVAGGGGGGGGESMMYAGGVGGGSNGGDGQGDDPGHGGTQTSGGTNQVGALDNYSPGTFGNGGSGYWGEESLGGGGGGWYGGSSAGGSDNNGGGGGGSGYVGGVEDGQTIAGDNSFPSPSGGTETGHTGNGYAIITQLSY